MGYDSHAYWAAVQDMGHLYGGSALSRDAYLYSPLFAQAIWPLGRLPWPVFGLIWSLLQAGLFVWLLRPLAPRWFAPAIVATVPEILTGNIYGLMACAVVLGVDRGTPWLLPTLTKVTPGAVALTWLAAKRQWGPLARGVLVGAVLVGGSYIAAPTAWTDWVGLLSSGPRLSDDRSGLPLLPLAFLLAGLAVTLYGALTRRAWLLPVALLLVSPTFGPNTLTLLAAVPRLRRVSEGTAPAPRGARTRR